LIKYRTVLKESSAELTVRKSRFIARVRPVLTRGEADIFFDEIRREHHAARHNVPAFIIGGKVREEWSSEDVEPQGTAGAPILQLLSGEGITNAALMVTRYFGGIKLGTGGLARAYTGAAKAVLLKAGVCDVAAGVRLRYEMGYQAFERLRAVAAREVYEIANAEYGGNVNFFLCGPLEREGEMRKAAASAHGADIAPLSVDEADIVLHLA
jgi:uncharacterized YigZ family protein